MEDINKESDIFLLENTLLRLIGNINAFRDNIACMESSNDIAPIDVKQHEEFKKEFYKSLLNSFNEVKKFKRFQINKNWYTKENISVDSIYWGVLLNEIFCLKIRAVYNILQLNMQKLKIASKKAELNKNNSTIKTIEMMTYFDCDYCLSILVDFLEEYPEKDNEVLGENMIEKYILVLNAFFSKNKKEIEEIMTYCSISFHSR